MRSPWHAFVTIARLHIVAIAALGTLTFGWLFTGQRPWALAALAALDWFLVNLLNRVVDLREDRANAIPGTEFAAHHRRAILVVGGSLLVASLFAVHLVLPRLTPLRLAFHALGGAYNWPLRPGWRRLKQLYFWKNTASATGFLLTVFGYPLLAHHGAAVAVNAPTIVAAGLFFFLFELSYEVIYDLRDAPGDAAAAVATYPVVHGRAAAVRIIDGLLLSSLAVLVSGYLAGIVPWRILVMGLAPLLQLGLYKRALRRGIQSADCVRLTWFGVGLLVTYHLWVAAGLPGVGGAAS